MALFEGFKGLVVLLSASGLLALVHRDVHGMAVALVQHAHLNPASKYPRIFLDAAAQTGDMRLWGLAAGAAAYGLFRLVEAYGLYRGRRWAEVLAAASGAIYVPFEIVELLQQRSALVAALLALNVMVVAFMVQALLARRKAGE